MQCRDCFQYQSSCSDCFLKAHKCLPFHWAHVWDTQLGFFERKDFSALGGVIYLGHNGDRCPYPSPVIHFTVPYTNGIHTTLLRFCQCVGGPRRDLFSQLMKARLFPGTMRDPRTAVSFKVLKDFHFHNLESKKAAYDYLGALARLTDNVCTADIPVSLSISGPHK